jgi:hypothetical protein
VCGWRKVKTNEQNKSERRSQSKTLLYLRLKSRLPESEEHLYFQP